MSMLVKSKFLMKSEDFLTIVGIKGISNVLCEADNVLSNDEVTIISYDNWINSYRSDYQLLKSMVCKFNFYNIVEVDESNVIENISRILNEDDEALFQDYNLFLKIEIKDNCTKDLNFRWNDDNIITTLNSKCVRSRKEMLEGCYPIGTRVKLISTVNKEISLSSGLEGTVVGYDDLPSLLMKWDNRSSLKLMPFEGDKFIKI